MRVPGRFWWACILAATASPAVSMLLCVWWLTVELPLDRDLGRANGGTLAIGCGIVAFGLLVAPVLARIGLLDRHRCRLRLVVLRGHLDAIPLAHFAPDIAPPHDLSAGPVVLFWSATPLMRCLEGPLWVLLVLLKFAALPLFAVAMIVFAIVTVPSRVLHADPPTLLLIVVMTAASVAALIGVAIWFRAVPTYFGRPFGVMATDDGIEYRARFGRRYLIYWHDIRLFEVEGTGTAEFSERRFRAYGAWDVAEWHHDPAKHSEYAPHGITRAEMARRLDLMVALIHARTGLTPRTFSKAVQAPNVPTAP